MKIKNNPITWLILTAIVMLAFPWLTITFIKGDAGMTVCFILFFVINPLFNIISGVFAGRNPKKLWVCPLMTGILFILGCWLSFEMGQGAFVVYGIGYCAIGAAAMGISVLFSKILRR